jgi:hypothetical protein
MERTRVIVFRRVGVEGAPVEGVDGGLRRKSVRMSAPLGWGSEIFPNEEPLRLRVDLRWWAPRMQIVATVLRMPATRPGKKPTRTAGAGNLLQDSVIRAVPFVLVTGITEADCVLVEDCVGDAVGAAEEEDVGVGGAESCWFAFMMQTPFVLQLYPKGQHPVPHVNNVDVSAVVCSVLAGFNVPFCLEMSQVMGWIVAQSEPFGQHNTVVFAARGMQVWPCGQQKEDGRPASVHCK